MSIKTSKKEMTPDIPKRKSLFDHVNHIRKVQDPDYYKNLSEDDRKSFNHFMILRALSMDDFIIEDIAVLYRYVDKIPSPQLYQLLVSLVAKGNKYCPWIKTKVMKHNQELLSIVANKFQVPKYQANEYVNILIRTESGQSELINICKSFGLDDKEIEPLFEERKYE